MGVMPDGEAPEAIRSWYLCNEGGQTYMSLYGKPFYELPEWLQDEIWFISTQQAKLMNRFLPAIKSAINEMRRD